MKRRPSPPARPAPQAAEPAVAPEAARLFDEPGPDEADTAGDAAALARLATLASGRAMQGRLWAEARALAGLAESYARLADRAARRGEAGAGQEPDEAAFEAVRRKVLGLDAGADEEDGFADSGPTAS